MCFGTSDWVSSVLVSALKDGESNNTFVCLCWALKVVVGDRFSNRICFRQMVYSQSVHCYLLVLLMLAFSFVRLSWNSQLCVVFLRKSPNCSLGSFDHLWDSKTENSFIWISHLNFHQMIFNWDSVCVLRSRAYTSVSSPVLRSRILSLCCSCKSTHT